MLCCIIGGKCGLEGFLDLDPGLVCICDAFIFELGEPSLSKGFFSYFGHPVKENHSLHFIGVFVCIKDKVGLHGHEPSVGTSGFSAELFKEGGFNFHVIIFFIDEEIYMDERIGEARRERVWETGR